MESKLSADKTLINFKDGKNNQDSNIVKIDNSKLQYKIQRSVLLQVQANQLSGYDSPTVPIMKRIKKLWLEFSFLKLLVQFVPILDWLPKYSCKNYICGDLSAGITVGVMHIPQGMAYGLLAEVPPETGLYMAFLPTLAYAIFGTSRHNSMGTFAVISTMCANIVVEHSPSVSVELNTLNETLSSPNSVYTPIQIVTAISFCTSIIYFIMFLLRLGLITQLLSDPLISGFITGASVHTFVSQLKDIFGIMIPRYKSSFRVPLSIYYLFEHITEVNYTALTVASFIILYMFCMNEFFKPWFAKKSRFPFPIELFAIILGLISSLIMKFQETGALQLVGDIPAGLPTPVLPPFALIKQVALESIFVGIISYSMVVSLGMVYANKNKYKIRPNQELLALSMSNMVGAVFLCIPMSTSLSRTALQSEVGGKTQIASVFSASIILMVLLWIGPIFEILPRSVLGGIIVVALKSIYKQALDIKKFYRADKLEVLTWIVTFFTVVIIDIEVGLIVGVISSIVQLYINGLKHFSSVLGQINNTGVYVDIKYHRNAQEIPKTKIIRYCGSINFATRTNFQSSLYKALNLTDSTLKNAATAEDDTDVELNRLYTVILDLSCCAQLDQAGCRVLDTIQHDLITNSLILLLACPSDNVYKSLEYSIALGLEPFLIFPTVHDAVLYAQETHKATASDVPRS